MAVSKFTQASRLTGSFPEGSFTWRRSFTLSIGATAVLEIAAEMPPAKKSLAKEIAVSFMVRCFLRSFQVTNKHTVSPMPSTAVGLHRRNGRFCIRVEDLSNDTDRETTRELRLDAVGQSSNLTWVSANYAVEEVTSLLCVILLNTAEYLRSDFSFKTEKQTSYGVNLFLFCFQLRVTPINNGCTNKDTMKT